MIKLISRGKVRDIYEVSSSIITEQEKKDFSYQSKRFSIKDKFVFGQNGGIVGTLIDNESFDEIRKAILTGKDMDKFLSKMFFKYEVS